MRFFYPNPFLEDGGESQSLLSVLRLACALLSTQIAVVSLFDGGTWRIHRALGLEHLPEHWVEGMVLDEGSRPFCDFMEKEREPLLVPDARRDLRWNEHELVRELGVRFYAGTPLLSADGVLVGTLCTVDFEPRSSEQLNTAAQSLEDLARLALETLARSRSERLYHTLVEKGADILSIFGVNGAVEYQSPSLEKMLGYAPHEWLGQQIFSLVHPSDQEMTLAAFERIAQKQSDCEMVRFRFPHKSGQWRTLECVGFDCTDDLAIRGILVTTRDVTERVQAEQKLQETEERFEIAFERSPIGMALVAPDGKWLRVNRKLCEILGYSELELLKIDFQSVTHPDDLESDLALVQEVLAGKREHFQMEKRYIHARGHTFWAELNVSLVRDSRGEPLHFISEVQDITMRRAQEERLRLLESVAVNAQDAIIITEFAPLYEPGPRILYANQAFTEMTGYSSDEIIGRSPRFLHGPETSREEGARIRAHLDNCRPVNSEIINYRKDGTPFWVELSIAPVPDENGIFTHFVSLQRDITARKETEAALRSARSQAESASLSKSEFLRRMSHEVRTPLNAILGFAQMLEVSDLSAVDRQNVHYILGAGHHLLEILNEVLDMARIEHGQMQILIERICVADLVKDLLDWVRPLAQQNGLSIEYNAIENCQYTVLSDAKRVRQILLNLLSNALKFNRVGGKIGLHCRAICHENNLFLRLEVSDEGMGIAPEKRQRMFQAFERLDADARGIEGSGLGLALSLNLAKLMGGSLGFESVPGQGSTFWLELPVEAKPQPVSPNDRF